MIPADTGSVHVNGNLICHHHWLRLGHHSGTALSVAMSGQRTQCQLYVWAMYMTLKLNTLELDADVDSRKRAFQLFIRPHHIFESNQSAENRPVYFPSTEIISVLFPSRGNVPIEILPPKNVLVLLLL